MTTCGLNNKPWLNNQLWIKLGYDLTTKSSSPLIFPSGIFRQDPDYQGQENVVIFLSCDLYTTWCETIPDGGVCAIQVPIPVLALSPHNQPELHWTVTWLAVRINLSRNICILAKNTHVQSSYVSADSSIYEGSSVSVCWAMCVLCTSATTPQFLYVCILVFLL